MDRQIRMIGIDRDAALYLSNGDGEETVQRPDLLTAEFLEEEWDLYLPVDNPSLLPEGTMNIYLNRIIDWARKAKIGDILIVSLDAMLICQPVGAKMDSINIRIPTIQCLIQPTVFPVYADEDDNDD